MLRRLGAHEEVELRLVSDPPRVDDRGLRLLVVDDDHALRILLRTTLEVVDIEVEEADSAAAAEKLIARRAPDVVVLDVGMPGMDGLTFCRQLKGDPVTADIGVVLLTGSDREIEAETQSALADAFLRKPFSPLGLLNAVERIVGSLYQGPFRAASEPRKDQDESIEYGFLLHDVGKIGIPDRILQKQGSLTRSERRLLETHTVLGEQLVSGIALLQGQGLQIVRHHHERWDGLGYPDALGETEIPLGARVFAVADALDAMTSDRPYRRARSWEEAAGEIAREAGRQFDPHVVDPFRERASRLRRIHYEPAAT